MARMLINDDELSAMDGISHLAIALYIKGIRPYMDYKTAITGWKRGISYQSLSEEVYVEPVAGRHKDKTGSPSKSATRNAIKELIKAGLLSVIPAGMKLVFKLNLASSDYSAQKRSDTGVTQVSNTGATQREAALLKELQEIKKAMSDIPKPHRSDTPPISDGYINNTHYYNKDLYKENSPVSAKSSGSGGVIDFDALIFDKRLGGQQIETIKTVLSFNINDTATAQTLLDELSGAMTAKDVKNAVAYFRAMVRRLEKGEFEPTAAIDVAQRRERKRKEQEEARARHEYMTKPKEERVIDNKKLEQHRKMMKQALKKG